MMWKRWNDSDVKGAYCQLLKLTSTPRALYTYTQEDHATFLTNASIWIITFTISMKHGKHISMYASHFSIKAYDIHIIRNFDLFTYNESNRLYFL